MELPTYLSTFTPAFADNEVVTCWVPIKVKGSITEHYPAKWASGIAILTNENLWYCSTTFSVGLSLPSLRTADYKSTLVTATLTVTNDKGHQNEFKEGRRYVRKLSEALAAAGVPVQGV